MLWVCHRLWAMGTTASHACAPFLHTLSVLPGQPSAWQSLPAASCTRRVQPCHACCCDAPIRPSCRCLLCATATVYPNLAGRSPQPEPCACKLIRPLGYTGCAELTSFHDCRSPTPAPTSKAPKTHKPPKTTKAPKTHKPPKTTKAPKTHKPPKTKPPKTHKPPRTHKPKPPPPSCPPHHYWNSHKGCCPCES